MKLEILVDFQIFTGSYFFLLKGHLQWLIKTQIIDFWIAITFILYILPILTILPD